MPERLKPDTIYNTPPQTYPRPLLVQSEISDWEVDPDQPLILKVPGVWRYQATKIANGMKCLEVVESGPGAESGPKVIKIFDPRCELESLKAAGVPPKYIPYVPSGCMLCDHTILCLMLFDYQERVKKLAGS